MKRMLLISISAAIFASGCSIPEPKPSIVVTVASTPRGTAQTALEGLWKGQATTAGHEGSATLNISGNNLEFHGPGENDWVKGTFTLKEDANPKQLVGTITDCPSGESIGKPVYAIYKIEDGTLTIAGNAPGETDFPSAFNAPGVRELVLKRE